MTTQIETKITLLFNFNGHPVRIIGTWGTPRFVAADLCDVLDIGDTYQAVNGRADRGGQDGLDDDEKGHDTVMTLGGPQEVITVTESGLYSLIFKSRKVEAKAFKRWVTHEVLPSIRKTGGYVHDVEAFLTHPIMKDLEAAALERVTRTMELMVKHHLTPHLEKNHTDIPFDKLRDLLTDMKRFMSNYFPNSDGELSYLPKSQRKAKPSRFIQIGWTEKDAEEHYRMTHKHIPNPLMTLEEFKAKVCDRPLPGITAGKSK